MTTRDALTAANLCNRISLKGYSRDMSRSLLLNFVALICQSFPYQGSNRCSFKEKGS